MVNQEYVANFEAEFISAGMPAKNDWYHDARTMVLNLAEKHGIDFKVCAAAVAVLSPRVAWYMHGEYRNLKAADSLIKGFKHHKKKAVVFSSVPGFDFNKSKAWDILRTGDISLVSGPKVSAFYNNIVDPDNHDYVTIDSWMVAIATGYDLSKGKDKLAPTVKQRDEIIQAMEHCCDYFGVDLIDFQATVWENAKRRSGHWRTM